MRNLACLLLLGVASVHCQNAAVDFAAAPIDVAPAAAAAPAAAPDATAAASVATGAATGPATAAAAGGLANRGTIGLNLGPAFYGPGLNNANAIRPNQLSVNLLQNYLKTAPNAANLRVFVDIDGRMHFTDQFGQETEVLHPQYGDLTDLFQDPIEVQDRLNEFRQQSLDQAINRCQTDLRQRFFNDPASFTPDIFAGLNTLAGVGGAAGLGAGVGPRAVVA